MPLRIRPITRLRRSLLVVLLGTLSVPPAPARKARPVLDWKTGVLWETPDACNETSPVYKETFLILADDTLYHVAFIPIRRKPNVTERREIKYDIIQGDLYLQDDDGHVFKLSIVKKEQDPAARQLLNSGKMPCQP